jgi:hypothetical protein
MIILLVLVFGFCNGKPQDISDAHNRHVRSGAMDHTAELTSEDEVIVISGATHKVQQLSPGHQVRLVIATSSIVILIP